MQIDLTDDWFNENNRTIPIPRGIARVEIGSGDRCLVRLPGAVPALVAGLALQPSGWALHNLAPDESPVDITLGPVTLDPVPRGTKPEQHPSYRAKVQLWQPGHAVYLAGQTLSVRIDRYQITIVLDRDEFAPATADTGRLSGEAVALVRAVHEKLMNQMVKSNADSKEKYEPKYLLELETSIERIAGQEAGFPEDGTRPTPLGDHLAGVAVQSKLIHDLIEESGRRKRRARGAESADADPVGRRTGHEPDGGWDRLRTTQDRQEQELTRLVAEARAAVVGHLGGRPDADDLTARMTALAEVFWDHWTRTLGGPDAPGAGTRRYLALRRLKEEIKDYWYGAGPLEDLFDDPTITDIMVVDRRVYVDTGGQIQDSGRRFVTDPLPVVSKIVARANREINDSSPTVNVRLPDGSRMNAVHWGISIHGTCVTIRRFPKVRWTMAGLIEEGSITPSAAAFLRAAVRNRRNILVSGGTGSGKTTFLNCLGEYIPEKERVVTIEDTAELQLPSAHVVPLQGRPDNLQGKGRVTIQELVTNSLRMRPDRIIVGECREAEALDMLQAMNTGHDGSLTTLHANSPADVIERLETMCQMANTDLPVGSIHRMVASAVDLVVQLTAAYVRTTSPSGGTVRVRTRVVSEIAEFVGLRPGGGIVIKTLFRRPPEGGPLRPTGCLPTFMPAMIDAGLVPDPIEFLHDPTVAA